MDGIHDLGGMEGFGPVAATFEQNPFPGFADWEKRVVGLSYTLPLDGMTIDWFRHVVELMAPRDYLQTAYFDKWCAAYVVMFTDNGTFTLPDFGRPSALADTGAPSGEAVAAVLAQDRASAGSYERPAGSPPAFAVGQTVRTRAHMHSGHHRLPRYARDAEGRIISHHGCHPLPDASARGTETPEHLYTVRFDARTLWGPDAPPNDHVALDLWESYLVPA
ncbi:nitrile hydratase subunit beta [Roseovarius sp.]|uniref:nitrile hydratase subunit beta n=1 Tax=Roseovarius sp. TaxID=1486281 RepID=UPI0026232E10|nr:nitrile hydratase subunit beta [Roseovarius sp.]MDM8166521.1 nitrile hydratase subunit beta [Roseovarius sp.]